MRPLPTPAIAYLTRAAVSAGIVISASHNPFDDNGIKFSGGGAKLADAVELAIEQRMESCSPAPAAVPALLFASATLRAAT